MCTELLPPGGYTIAVKYIISYHVHGKFYCVTDPHISAAHVDLPENRMKTDVKVKHTLISSPAVTENLE
jgi:hypothetical protein